MNEDRNTRGSPGARAEEQLASMADAAGKSVVDAVRPLQESVRSYAEQQKALGAEQVDGVARAAHRAAQEIEAQMPGVARSVHRAASRLDGASSALRERNLEELTKQLGEFARAQPAVFFGGAVLAGFALSRFLKTSARR
ncbi:MAG TPA: hypothetical protein VL742_19015 [Casimicrobiaceae bacterium]|nr:hypothetical protein [Casimicrobiaceae bacterium]